MTFAAPAGSSLIEELGAGSVFEVAMVLRDGARCICKRLRARMRTEPAARATLERERVALGTVHHASLPALLGHGEDGHGPYLFESVVEGRALSLLAGAGSLPPDLLGRILRAAFAALAELHALADERGPLDFALGDLGPDHVIIGRQRGHVGFVDLGQASWRDHPPRPGERGTLPFTAPEVARGEALLSQASDVYALAAALAFAAVGEDLCHESGPALLTEISERGLDVALLPGCDALGGVDGAALARALAFDPARRTPSAAAVLAELATAR